MVNIFKKKKKKASEQELIIGSPKLVVHATFDKESKVNLGNDADDSIRELFKNANIEYFFFAFNFDLSKYS